MIPIPEELLDQVERGNVLLFIGERVGRDGRGQAVIDQLAAELAARSELDDPEDYNFPEAAQAYQDKMGRQALIQFVRDQLEARGDEPEPVHRLIAGLTFRCRVLVSTCLDRKLERAIQEAKRPLDVVIGDIDLPFEDEQKIQLYKLRGSIERIESLLLTEDDYEDFYENHQASVSVVLQGYLVRKTILFLGYDLEDPHFKRLYRTLTSSLDNFVRRAYAFGEAPAQKVSQWCARNRIEVVETPTTAFLEALTEQLAARARPAPTVSAGTVEDLVAPVPERPYKHLDFYEAKDAANFFGRASETGRLTALIHAHRLVLLYGASGVGKTSLLHAGCQPRLDRADPPYEILFVRALEDPSQVIREGLSRRLPEADLPQAGSLVEFLDAGTRALKHTLVVVLDQFEEFFIRFSPKFRSSFVADLGRLYDARDVPVKVVFSLREDWLASMSEIEARIPEVFRTSLRLLPLSLEQAHQAITAPVERLGVRYDPGLVRRLFDDLAGQRTSDVTGDVGGAVMPYQLQLVCDALYERVHAEGRQYIEMADYEAVGQVRGILARSIETALHQHPSGDRDLAKAALMALVSSQATRAVADLESIAASVRAEQTAVEPVLSRLIGSRLVRRLGDGQGYELTHDLLAATIASWVSEEDRLLKLARELLRRELADWQQDRKVLLSQSKFQRISGVRNSLKPTQEEAALLARAAVLYDEDVPFWLEQVSEPEAQAEILLDMLGNDADQARLNAAKYMAGFDQEPVALALAHVALEDPRLEVREAGALSLGQVGGTAGISHMIDVASARESTQQSLAVHALALIQDVAPEQLAGLDGPTRRTVLRELAIIRLRRNWPRMRAVTVAGAVGGAAGFGLGLAPPTAWHAGSLLGAQSLLDVVFITPLLAVFGMLGGAVLALGLSAGEALFSRKAALGRILGGALVGGGLGFAAVLSPLAIVDAEGFVDGLLTVAGGGLLGMLIGLGITLPTVLIRKRGVMLAGGAAGAALGVVLWGTLGYDPFQILSQPSVPAPVLLAFGGLTGLLMAFSLARALARWSSVEAV